MSLKARVDRLHSTCVNDVSSEIIVYQKKKVLRRVWRGANLDKVVRIVIRL
jgi:hypothetical protein